MRCPHCHAVGPRGDCPACLGTGTYIPAEDRLPRVMVEAATEYDWAELPEGVKATVRAAAQVLTAWAAGTDTIPGEIVTEPCHESHSHPDPHYVCMGVVAHLIPEQEEVAP